MRAIALRLEQGFKESWGTKIQDGVARAGGEVANMTSGQVLGGESRNVSVDYPANAPSQATGGVRSGSKNFLRIGSSRSSRRD